ncbi:MAG TPA: transcription termination/antitermination NusG family protein [Hyphomicrobiaceae bacterium]|jgi:transcriptional antiterminator RfaH|nr:transcription termination/antitermination NusG family protein [Hyphomicrobiaceae bacterium]
MIQPGHNGAVSWILVSTHPHKERFAVENLNRQRFVGYCPMLRKRIRHARRSELALRPMFPAHVIAGLHADTQRWQAIRSTPGVSAIVRSGELPVFLPAGFVDALQASEVDGTVAAPTPAGGTGPEVIAAGADYRAQIAAMLKMTERERLLSLIGLLGPPRA